MTPLFKKLNLKDQTPLLILNAPASFEPELAALKDMSLVRAAKGVKAVIFMLAFVTQQREVEALAKVVAQKAVGDAVIWFAYPKGTSKNYTCDFNRDTGWAALEATGYLGVRMVALDADWSALRFRHKDYIKSLTRK